MKFGNSSHELVCLAVYRCTEAFPRTETYGLRSQVRRAAVSIPSNIAEGSCRESDPDFRRFLLMSFGSANEVEYQLLLARDLGYMEASVHEELNANLVTIKKMLYSLIGKLKLGGPKPAFWS